MEITQKAVITDFHCRDVARKRPQVYVKHRSFWTLSPACNHIKSLGYTFSVCGWKRHYAQDLEQTAHGLSKTQFPLLILMRCSAYVTSFRRGRPGSLQTSAQMSYPLLLAENNDTAQCMGYPLGPLGPVVHTASYTPE